jgi:hypothetical protein
MIDRVIDHIVSAAYWFLCNLRPCEHADRQELGRCDTTNDEKAGKGATFPVS